MLMWFLGDIRQDSDLGISSEEMAKQNSAGV
jgi:hypothetical protein